MTLGQGLQGHKNLISKMFPNFVKNKCLRFLSVEDKLLKLGTISKTQHVALEILNRDVHVKFDLRSTFKFPEVSKGPEL